LPGLSFSRGMGTGTDAPLAVAAVSDRRRRSEIGATISSRYFFAPNGRPRTI
jgi:hypothetical protein